MGFEQGHLEFQNPYCTAGDVLHGKLVFNLEKVKTFRGLYIKAKGHCDVEWSSRRSRTVNGKTEHYTVYHRANETYFENKVYLVGSSNGSVTLQPGHYEYPFQFSIPGNCPSTFSGNYGNIEYKVKAVVDRPMRFDQEIVRILNVKNPKDLNLEPYCKEPMVFEFHESYCCWCMSSGTCDVQIAVPASGFCPGQTIRIEVSVVNKSSVEIDTISFELKEEICYTANLEPDSKTLKEVLAKIQKGPIAANTTRNWTIEMDVPDRDIYNLDSCKFIDIDHAFQVKIKSSGCHSDNSASRRVVLGDVPLRDYSEIGPEPNVSPQQQSGLNQGYPNQPYPGSPYPQPTVPPYPQPNVSPYPQPNVSPYPQPAVAPYPQPAVSPYPVPGAYDPSPPYPGNLPYPTGNAPFQGTPHLPVMGFAMQNPTPISSPNPYASASAPVSTPDSADTMEKKPM